MKPCQATLIDEGKAYPKTCERCGLGQCTRTLEEVSANGDGTYNGIRVIQFLYHATTRKYLSEQDAKDLWAQAQAKAAERRGAV